MSSKPIDKKTFSASDMSGRIAGYLDKKDGTPDNLISKKEWNFFANYAGLEETDKDYITVEEAQVGLDTLLINNPEKIVNYSREYLNRKITLKEDSTTIAKNNTPKPVLKDTTFLESIQDSLIATAKPAVRMVLQAGKYSKTFADKAIVYMIKESSVDSVRTCIRAASDLSAPAFPVASQLLHISTTPSELRVGKHNDYTVHSPQQSKTRLAELGMHENDTSAYGKINEHLTSEQMKLKTVEFNKNSEASDMINGSPLVKAAIDAWEADGRPNKKYYSGIMNNTGDELLAINSCLVCVTNVKENGNKLTYTGYVEDVYDFDETYSQNVTVKAKAIDTINKAAFAAQEKGAIQKYRVLIPFSVTVGKK